MLLQKFLNTLCKTITGNSEPRNSATTESNHWDSEALAMQQVLLSNFRGREWSYYRGSDQVALKKNVGFALFGPPDELPQDSNNETGYSAKKLELVEKVLEKIKENDKHDQMSRKSISIRASTIQPLTFKSVLSKTNDEIKKDPESSEDGTVMSVIFVVVQVGKGNEERAVPEPVFRVLNESDGVNCCRYIDRSLHVYKGWDEFLYANSLPAGRYCYPVNGVYEAGAGDQVLVKFGETPASRKLGIVENINKIKEEKGEINGSVVSESTVSDSDQETSTSRKFAMSSKVLFLFANTVMMVDDVNAISEDKLMVDGRFVEEIASKEQDAMKPRRQDGDLEGLTDSPEDLGNRDTWQTIDVNNLGMVAMGASTMTNQLKISPKTTNCYGVLNAAHFLHEKHKDKTELTPEEVAQFSACVLFFTMSAIGDKAVRKVIKEADEEMVNSLRSSTGRCSVKLDVDEIKIGLPESPNFTFIGRSTEKPLGSLGRMQNGPRYCKGITWPTVREEREHKTGWDLFSRLKEPPSPFTRECAEFNLLGAF